LVVSFDVLSCFRFDDLDNSEFSIRFVSSPFSAISYRFVTKARVGDEILGFNGSLIVLATLAALVSSL